MTSNYPLAETPSAQGNWRRTLLAYAVAGLICVAILIWLLELWKVDLRVPVNYGGGDSLLYLACFRAIPDTGWYFRHDRLGAPFPMRMYDFPMTDAAHFFAVKLLYWCCGDLGLAISLYYLLTFPLSTLAALFVMRRLNIGFVPAVACGLLYAYLPFHLMRLGHYFLACYYHVPMMILVILEVYPGRPGSKEASAGPSRLGKRDLLLCSAICLFTGAAGVYYAAFALFFLAVAALAAWFSPRRWQALRLAVGCSALVFLSVLAGLAPTLAYSARHGRNEQSTNRKPYEAEIFGLKIAQMLLPVPHHRWQPLADLRADYAKPRRPLLNENETSALGTIGAAGLIGLLGWLLLRRRAIPEGSVTHALALFAIAAILFATIGGFIAIVNLLTVSYIRSCNRIVVFIAFFSLVGVAGAADRLWRRLATTPRRALLCMLGAGLLTAAGLWDEVPCMPLGDLAEPQRQFAIDQEFAERVEASLPPGSMIYQIPWSRFPEAPAHHRMQEYDHLRPYLHTHSLRFSHGSMRGRQGDRWHLDLDKKPMPERIGQLVESGFTGIWVDRAGYADNGAAVEAELRKRQDQPPLVSQDERFAFYRLSPISPNGSKRVATNDPRAAPGF